MTELFSEDDVIATVTRLTRTQLIWFMEGAFVSPNAARMDMSFAAST
jgi:hypothetical protein